MSQFDKYTTSQFVESLRVFLCIKKQGFLKNYAFFGADVILKPGRTPHFKKEAVDTLIFQANEKAMKAESGLTSMGERISIARDYMAFSDSELSRRLDVSRELVRLWRNDVHKPKAMSKVAEALAVPLIWLETGNQNDLPADSRVGVRVGSESLKYREELYSMTVMSLDSIDENADSLAIQTHLEKVVKSNLEMAKISRRAGGRWQHNGESLVFAPWIPIQKYELVRRYWSDEVEAIIETELSSRATVYGAWSALKKKCDALGMNQSMYPTKIALYKRLAKSNSLEKKFGIDLNFEVNNSINGKPTLH